MLLVLTSYLCSWFYLSDESAIAETLIRSCSSYINAERVCVEFLSQHPDVRKEICQIENAVISLATSDLTEGVCYAATFLLDNK
jgi:hypothetical protein